MGCNKKKEAFTLTELLVVVLVLGVLAGVAVPKFKRVLETRKTEEAVNMLGEVRREQEQRCMMGNRYWGEDKKNKVAVLANASTSKNYTYTLTNQGAVATAKGGNYTLQIPSYKEGVVCCSGDGCAALNKSYPNCNDLAATVDECVAEVEVPEPPEPLATCEPYSWTSSFEIGSGASWGTCYTSHNVTCSETNEEVEHTYSNGCVCRTSGYRYVSGSCVAPAEPPQEEECEEGVASGGVAGGMADTCDGDNLGQYSCDGEFKGSCTDVYRTSVSGASVSVNNASWWLPSDSFSSFQQGILLAVSGPGVFYGTCESLYGQGADTCPDNKCCSPGYSCYYNSATKSYGCQKGSQAIDAGVICTADQIVLNGRCIDKVPVKDGGIKDWDPDDPFIPNDPVVPTDPTPVVSYSYRTVTCCGTGGGTAGGGTDPEDPPTPPNDPPVPPVTSCDENDLEALSRTVNISHGTCTETRTSQCKLSSLTWKYGDWVRGSCNCESGYTYNTDTETCEQTNNGSGGKRLVQVGVFSCCKGTPVVLDPSIGSTCGCADVGDAIRAWLSVSTEASLCVSSVYFSEKPSSCSTIASEGCDCTLPWADDPYGKWYYYETTVTYKDSKPCNNVKIYVCRKEN